MVKTKELYIKDFNISTCPASKTFVTAGGIFITFTEAESIGQRAKSKNVIWKNWKFMSAFQKKSLELQILGMKAKKVYLLRYSIALRRFSLSGLNFIIESV